MRCTPFSILGWASRNGSRRKAALRYRFQSEGLPPLPLKLKVETNSREHFAVHGFTRVPFAVRSRWFEGACDIASYELDELLATKFRALYQRRKGRDLLQNCPCSSQRRSRPSRPRILCLYARGWSSRDTHGVRGELGPETLGPTFRSRYRSAARARLFVEHACRGRNGYQAPCRSPGLSYHHFRHSISPRET